MKMLLLVGCIVLSTVRCAIATPQVNDKIVISNHQYGIFQMPMSAYWYLDDEAPAGRIRLPPFETTSSANWRGYTAKWSISRGKLYLDNVEGQIAGKKVSDRNLIDKRFPIHARWFSGSIFISVGDFNDETNEFEYVLEFKVTDGNVVETVYHESLSIPMTWNGQPYVQSAKNEGTGSTKPEVPKATTP